MEIKTDKQAGRVLSSTQSISPRAKPPLLPSLFDRLTDNFPTQTSESPSEYTVTDTALRKLIRRDLADLLNTINLDGLLDEARHPLAAGSCLNFGIPPLAGRDSSTVRWPRLEWVILQAIRIFEPRLSGVSVEPLPSSKRAAAGDPHQLRFQIRAEIRCRPYPLVFIVQSAVDLETSRLGGWTEQHGPA